MTSKPAESIYPFGLQGTQIPMAARIFAIIDVWDTMSHRRVYKDAWPKADVIKYFKSQAGIHFDPAIKDEKQNVFRGEHREIPLGPVHFIFWFTDRFRLCRFNHRRW
jgi:hypothetical protein